MSEIGAHGSPDLQFQRGELLDGHSLFVRARRGVPSPGVSRATVENSPSEVAVASRRRLAEENKFFAKRKKEVFFFN